MFGKNHADGIVFIGCKYLIQTRSKIASEVRMILVFSTFGSVTSHFNEGPTPRSNNSVTGIKPISATQAAETLVRYCPQTVPSNSLICVTIKVETTKKTKGRVYLTFGNAGVWEKAVNDEIGLLYRISEQCKVLHRLVNVSNPDMSFIKEWHNFQRSEQKEGTDEEEDLTLEINEEDYDEDQEDEEDRVDLRRQLALAQSELKVAKDKIAYLEERIALRENTLVNVLIGSHPAFEGLDDYPKRRKLSKDKENKVDFNVIPKIQTYTPAASTTNKTLSRTLSSQGKAVRVATSATKKKKQVAAPGQTPGNRCKTKSRLG